MTSLERVFNLRNEHFVFQPHHVISACRKQPVLAILYLRTLYFALFTQMRCRYMEIDQSVRAPLVGLSHFSLVIYAAAQYSLSSRDLY